MRRPVVFSIPGGSQAGREIPLAGLPLPLDLDALVSGGGDWEVEIGFGKGRYLLQHARTTPERRFLGIEVVSKYYRLALQRARRQALGNLVLVRGEALYLLATVLPRGFATTLHVYFPDPWPKSRHAKRRLFDPETVDLALATLRPGGELCFASDYLDYGERVVELLASYPGLAVERLDGPWPDGARTNYEAKYVAENRSIVRCVAHLAGATGAAAVLHPWGASGVLAAASRRQDD